MKKRLLQSGRLRILSVGLVAAALVLSVAGVALAAWSDVSTSLVSPYGMSEEDLEGISQGYGDGTWKPQQPMLRKHFIKMAMEAFGLAQAHPAGQTFVDVLPSDPYFGYVEGAAATGLTMGVGLGKFAPNAQITREQAVAIIARWLAAQRGVDLATQYDAAGTAAVLGGFNDTGSMSSGLMDEMAYAVDESIVQGSQGLLQPKKTLTRIQGAAMLLRARAASGLVTTTTTIPGATTTSDTTTGPTTTTTTDTSTTTTTTDPSTSSTSSTSSTVSSSSSTSSSSSSTSSSTTSTTAGTAGTVFGKVLNRLGNVVAGATVKVVLNALDANYKPSGNNTVGTATSDAQGDFSVSVGSLPLGSIVDVSVVATEHTSVMMYGTYNEKNEEVNFADFGTDGGDRRMPVGEQMPPFPFEGLLPE